MASCSNANRGVFALFGFIVVCTAATVAGIIVMPYLVPRNCADSSMWQEDVVELRQGAAGPLLRIFLNTKRTAKKFGKYFYCSDTDKYLKDKSIADVSCRTYSWRVPAYVRSVTDCIELGQQSWFGGSIMWHQYWPINQLEHEEAAYIPGDVYRRQYGGVMERFWISSGGFAVFVEDDVPLLLEMRGAEGRMCLTGDDSSGNGYNVSALNADAPRLEYSVCRGPSIRALYEGLRLWETPKLLPDRELFAKPIWSTWAYLKQNISTESVLDYARNISAANLSCSQFEIDDKWSDNYGDHRFDARRFPNPAALVGDIHALGYNVTIWVHPFVNNDSDAFREAKELMLRGQTYLVATAENRSLPGLTDWWRGDVSTLVDVTDINGTGTTALRRKLQSLLDFGVDSFKFDGGETNWIPGNASFAVSRVNPGWYTHAWSEFSYSMDRNLRRQETRVGFRAQNLPFLVRTMDKDSHWELDNGLKAMVGSALTHCLLGYNFFLPDMIGGNAYCNDTGLEGRCYPDKDLYIRWLQASVFMPSLQFSVPPWIYGSDVVEHTRRMLAIREEARFTENMDKALQDAMDNVPIVRPIWWVSNSHFEIYDQFLLGDRILVAPVLNPNQTHRRIVFPTGKWRPWFAVNSSSDIDATSARQVDQYAVPLFEVAAFYLVQDEQ